MLRNTINNLLGYTKQTQILAGKIIQCDYAGAREALANGADVKQILAFTIAGKPYNLRVLLIAAATGFHEIIPELIENGADVNQADDPLNLILLTAFRCAFNGAPSLLNAIFNNINYTSITRTRDDYIKTFKCLLDHGAKLGMLEYDYTFSPKVAADGNLELLQLMHQYHALKNIDMCIVEAAKNKHKEILRYLIIHFDFCFNSNLTALYHLNKNNLISATADEINEIEVLFPIKMQDGSIEFIISMDELRELEDRDALHQYDLNDLLQTLETLIARRNDVPEKMLRLLINIKENIIIYQSCGISKNSLEWMAAKELAKKKLTDEEIVVLNNIYRDSPYNIFDAAKKFMSSDDKIPDKKTMEPMTSVASKYSFSFFGVPVGVTAAIAVGMIAGAVVVTRR